MVLFVFRLLGVALIFYMFLISLRVLLSWFSQVSDSGFYPLLCKLTDPYLSLFRNIRFLKTAGFNYAPLLGIAILIILSNILIGIADTGTISLAAVLIIILTTIFSCLFWIILFFVALCLARFIFLRLRKAQGHVIWSYMDSILNPLLAPVLRLFHHKPDYQKLLITTVFMLAAVLIAGFFLVGLLLRVVMLIPF